MRNPKPNPKGRNPRHESQSCNDIFTHPANDCRRIVEEAGLHPARNNRPEADTHRYRCPSDAHDRGNRRAALLVNRGGVRCMACGFSGGVLDTLLHIGFAADREEALRVARERADANASRPVRRRRAKRRRVTVPRFLDPASAPPPSAARIGLVGRLWARIEETPLDRAASAYLRDTRGLSPHVARELGWRSTVRISDDVTQVLNDAAPEELLAAGFVGPNGKPWFPIAQAVPGFLIPIGHPDHAHPIGFRWRNLHGPKRPQSMYRGDGTAGLPYGFRPWAPTIVDPLSPGAVVFLVEGEMDWLAIVEATAYRLEGPPVGVLAFSDTSRWPGGLNKWLGSSRLVCALHDKAHSLRSELALAIPHALNLSVPEAHDLADMARAGRTSERVACGLGSELEVAVADWLRGLQ